MAGRPRHRCPRSPPRLTVSGHRPRGDHGGPERWGRQGSLVSCGFPVVEAGAHRGSTALDGHYGGLLGATAAAQVETGRFSGMRK
ncbi:hypothetical protein B005_2983 [Nocardiopsis alba ATCC BAA-2165]|uniref:Uncharacterized protein n=1 Tax=Nocardiopsis alba (strain ATCC BAA-2165 / BE74) TaxID=1205910 RepID=J7LAG6_NOCAA|nr:hypothetical protein B005_2983 [Nocardiopsis alba ATCC BAA-2165]